MNCINHPDREAEFTNEGGMCEPCWWEWWFHEYTNDELAKVAAEPAYGDHERARYELARRGGLPS